MTDADLVLLREEARRLGISLDEEGIQRLGTFLDVLAVWNRRVRLTADPDTREVIRRHVADSLAAARRLPPTGLVADIGSGAGFPGIVLGCVRPHLALALIESRRRRASFLSEAIRTIPLPAARAIPARAEDAARDPALAGKTTMVISRGVRIEAFLPLAAPLVAPSGVVVAMQTPASRARAERFAVERGFVTLAADEYRLLDGTSRNVLVFRRDDSVS